MDNVLCFNSYMLVKVKKLVPEAIIPSYAKPGDAGMDLVATSVDFNNSQYIEYGTGLAIEIPKGYVGYIFPRSSNSKYDLQLCNCVGVIDSGYRGEIKLRYRRIINPSIGRNFVAENHSFNDDKTKCSIMRYIKADFNCYEVGDKIGQLIIMPIPTITLEEVETLSDSDRGTGGFGSTGK